jgi:hypothetical protein
LEDEAMKAGDIKLIGFGNSIRRCRLHHKVRDGDKMQWVVDLLSRDGAFQGQVIRNESRLFPTTEDLKAENEQLKAALKQIGSGLLFFNPDRPMSRVERLAEEVVAIRTFANKALEE